MLNRGNGRRFDGLFRINPTYLSVVDSEPESTTNPVNGALSKRYGSCSTIGLITVCFHFIQALLVLILIFTYFKTDDTKAHSGEIKITRTYMHWTSNRDINLTAFNITIYANRTANEPLVARITYQMDDIGILDIKWGIFGFFCLSSIFQFIGLYPGLYIWLYPTTHSKSLESIDNPEHAIRWRYIEYSISASIMLICIAGETGITDIYTSSAMFGLMFATNILGFAVHEMVGSGVNALSCVVVHIASWLVCILAYSFVMYSFYLVTDDTVSRRPELKDAMNVVTGIVWTMCAMFLSFGLVQVYDIWVRLFIHSRKAPAEVTDHHLHKVAMTYDVLSFSAKTILAWMVLGPIFRGTF